MQLSTEERIAVENGQPVWCEIPGSNHRCVVVRDDVFDALRVPVSVIEEDVLDDIYSGLIQESPADWQKPAEWAAGMNSP